MKPTPVTDVPGGVVIVSGVVVVPVTVFGSSDVTTLRLEYEPALGLVTPGIVSTAGVLAPSEQPVPASVIVSVRLTAVPVAVHDVNPWLSVMEGVPAGSVKPDGNVTEMVSPATSAPPYGPAPVVGCASDVVNPTDQGWVIDAGWLPGAETAETFVPDAWRGETVVAVAAGVSTDVTTVKFDAV